MNGPTLKPRQLRDGKGLDRRWPASNQTVSSRTLMDRAGTRHMGRVGDKYKQKCLNWAKERSSLSPYSRLRSYRAARDRKVRSWRNEIILPRFSSHSAKRMQRKLWARVIRPTSFSCGWSLSTRGSR
jgi:hypothetical protein